MATQFTIKGRIVQGDPYKTEQRKDDKTGALRFKQDGSPMMSSFLALAIPKNDPAWPAFRAEHDADVARAWQPAQYGHRDFAHKIEDGDSIEPNKKGKRNVDREGFPGHWIVKLGSGYAPKVVYWKDGAGWVESVGQNDVPIGDGTQRNVQCGDYVTVIGSRDSNHSAQSPGMYQNLQTVAFEAPGAKIETTVDYASALGTRGPGGAGPTPAVAAAPAPASPAAPVAASSTASPGNTAPPPPGYSGFMDAPPPPPPPAPSGPVMTAKAGGATFDTFIAAGWTEATLREHGYIA